MNAKITIKKYVMDETLSWEERYKKLEAHHKEETAFLITTIENLEEKIESLEIDVYKLDADVQMLTEEAEFCRHNHNDI